MRILLIDDDEDLRNLVSRYIRGHWPDAQIDGYDPLERDLPSAPRSRCAPTTSSCSTTCSAAATAWSG